MLDKTTGDAGGTGSKVKVVEIRFRDDYQAELVVEMPDPERCSTVESPHIPRTLLKLFPSLARHRCRNDGDLTFRRECRATEIPHLLEHLIIELQGQAQNSGPLTGETEWDWRVEPRGRFHVRIEYENEILALGAIRSAERIINALASQSLDDLDIRAEIENLRRLARLGYEISRLSERELGELATATPVM